MVLFEVEQRRTDNVGTLYLFEQFRRWQYIGRPVKIIVWSVAQGVAVAPKHAVMSYAKKPTAEFSPAGVKPVEPLDGEQPDLLAYVFGSSAIPAKQVIDNAK